MSNEVNLKKKVLNSNQFKQIVDTSFSTFVRIPEEELPTIEEFFSFYDQLYFSIPVEGNTNSHEYLVRKSSELRSFDQDTQNIQPLLDEIASLRERLLEANTTITNLEIQLES